MTADEIQNKATKLLVRASNASKLPLFQRGEEATVVMVQMCALVFEMAEIIRKLEPYADE